MHNFNLALRTGSTVLTSQTATCRRNTSFICIVLCKLVGVQTCVSCCVMLSSRRILSPLSQAWGKSEALLSFMLYYHSSVSLLIQAASTGQCIRISKHWLGKDFYFQGDRVMFFLWGRQLIEWPTGGVHVWAVWSTSHSPNRFHSVHHVHLHNFPPVRIFPCRLMCLYDFFPSSYLFESLSSFSSRFVMSSLVSLDNLCIFTYNAYLTLLFFLLLAASFSFCSGVMT